MDFAQGEIIFKVALGVSVTLALTLVEIRGMYCLHGHVLIVVI